MQENDLLFEDDDTDTSDVEIERCSSGFDSRIMKEKNALMRFLDRNTELRREQQCEETNIYSLENKQCFCF